MRSVKYTTNWSYAGKGVKREGTLLDLILDVPFFIGSIGVMPPLKVFNKY
ncbi:MAG: hypothetical protein KC519_14990 [Anaerolineae bacterium]|nr:hypothetical protein [Anaerolineae bacterium]